MLGGPPPRRRRRRRRGSSRARCSHAYRFTATSRARGDAPSAEAASALVLSAHHDVAEPVARGARSSPRAQNRARDLAEHAGQRPHAHGARRVRAASSPAGSASGRPCSRTAGDPRSAGMGAFAAVAQGSREQARADPARLRRRRRRRRRAAARTDRQGGDVRHRAGSRSSRRRTMHEMKFDMSRRRGRDRGDRGAGRAARAGAGARG